MEQQTKKQETEQKTKTEEVMIDLSGDRFKENQEEFTRPLIPEDSYSATITDIKLIDVQKFEAKPGEKEKKFVFSYLIDKPQGEPVIITSFVNPSITKSNNPKYSNSKLFEIVSTAGLLQEVGELQDRLSTLEGLNEWLQKTFISRTCKVSIENNKKGTASIVRKVLYFEPKEVN